VEGQHHRWRSLRSIGQSNRCLHSSLRISLLMRVTNFLPHDVNAINPIISPMARMFLAESANKKCRGKIFLTEGKL
jgi:hypothetical protein